MNFEKALPKLDEFDVLFKRDLELDVADLGRIGDDGFERGEGRFDGAGDVALRLVVRGVRVALLVVGEVFGKRGRGAFGGWPGRSS